jgi:predicted NBD/HSP70 family sugar kinase
MESNLSERKKQNDEQNRMELPESLNYLANSDAAQAAIAFNKSTMPSVLPEVELIGHILPRESSSSKEKDEPPKDSAPKGGKRVFCEKVTQGEFSEYGKKLIEKFDTEKKGFLTKDQIVKELENASIQGKEAQALGAMYKNFSSLEKLTSQKSMWDSPGLAMKISINLRLMRLLWEKRFKSIIRSRISHPMERRNSTLTVAIP